MGREPRALDKGLAVFAVARIVVAGLLLWALARHPYGYYVLLRWVTCGVAVYSFLIALQANRTGWVVTFGGIALLFNPLIPVHIDRGTWSIVDVVAAVLFLGSVPVLRGDR